MSCEITYLMSRLYSVAALGFEYLRRNVCPNLTWMNNVCPELLTGRGYLWNGSNFESLASCSSQRISTTFAVLFAAVPVQSFSAATSAGRELAEGCCETS